MTLPLVMNFTTNSSDCNLYELPEVVEQMQKHFKETQTKLILNANTDVSITVLVNSVTQIKFSEDGAYNDFIVNKVYSSNGGVRARGIYIKDSGVSGTLSLQIE